MNAVDPSGYFFKKLKKELSRAWDDIRPYVGAIVGVALVYFTGGLSSSWFAATWYGAATGGAIAGAAGAAANGANLRGVLQGAALGAVSAAAFYGAGSAFAQTNCGSCYTTGNTLKTGAHVGKIAAHAAVGGVMSVLQGSKFGHGFSAAGFAQAFAPTIGALKGAKLMPARVAMASAIGGTASKLSGGKFANGAITGAFSRLFNEELHESAQEGEFSADQLTEPHLGKDVVSLVTNPVQYAQCTVDCAQQVFDGEMALKMGAAASGANVLSTGTKPGGATRAHHWRCQNSVSLRR